MTRQQQTNVPTIEELARRVRAGLARVLDELEADGPDAPPPPPRWPRKRR